jgi:hypothetical protein
MTKRVPHNSSYEYPARLLATVGATVARIEDFIAVFNEFDFDGGLDDVEIETSLEFNTDALTEGADEDVGYGSLIEKIGEVMGVEVSSEQEDTLRDLLSSVAYDVEAVIRGRLEGLEIEKSRGGFVVAKATASSVSEGLSVALQAALDVVRKEAREVERNAIRIHNERVREANAKVLPLPAPVEAPAPQPAPVAAPVPAPQPEPKAKARKPKAKADPAPAAPVAAPAAPAAPVAAPAAPVAAPAASATLPADLAALVAAIRAAPTELKAIQLAYPKAFQLTMALDIYVAGDDMKKARAIVAALRG